MEADIAMRDFLEYTLARLLDEPDQALLSQDNSEAGKVVFYLRVADDDYGNIIGARGKVIGALRNILAAGAMLHRVRVRLVLLDDDKKQIATAEADGNHDDGDAED